MVDTPRSVSALQTILADNTTRDISPQDLRDMLVSLQMPYGSFYCSTPAATTPAGASTPLKALGTTTSVSLSDFTMPVSNRLLYTGTATKHLHIAATTSFTSGGNNQLIGVHIYHFDDSAGTGAVLTHSKTRRFVSTGADEGSTALHADVTVDTDDYLEIWVENETSTSTITLQTCYLFATGMIV